MMTRLADAQDDSALATSINKRASINSTLASVNQHWHHQPRRDILILFVARLSPRSSRHRRWRGMVVDGLRERKALEQPGEVSIWIDAAGLAGFDQRAKVCAGMCAGNAKPAAVPRPGPAQQSRVAVA
jgi:hypothetical protein